MTKIRDTKNNFDKFTIISMTNNNIIKFGIQTENTNLYQYIILIIKILINTFTRKEIILSDNEYKIKQTPEYLDFYNSFKFYWFNENSGDLHQSSDENKTKYLKYKTKYLKLKNLLLNK